MPYYQRVGDVPRKRHIVHRADGSRLLEELMGAEGFSQESSLLYHRYSPSAVVAAERADDKSGGVVPNEPLMPRHIRTAGLAAAGDPVVGRRVLLGNDDVRMCWVTAGESSPLYRNGAGDELVYVHAGRATFESVFGRLDVGPGDYVVVPTSTTHRWLVDEAPLECLVFEARGHIRPPRRYLSDYGQFTELAPYSERDLRVPTGPLVVEGEGDGADVEVVVRHRGGLTRHRYAHHPFDVVGWDGCLYPYALSIHDFEPVVGLLHQPPPVHQTFAGPNFVVCSFVPRLYDFHPEAVKIPYHHANVDSDEVIFYAAGDFMSRAGAGIGVGSISLHPAGFVHGPQPGSYERSVEKDRTEELAVMLDTFRPLQLGEPALAALDDDYAYSWARGSG